MGHYEGARYNKPVLPRIHIGNRKKTPPPEPPRALGKEQRALVRKCITLLTDVNQTLNVNQASLHVTEVFRIIRDIGRELQKKV